MRSVADVCEVGKTRRGRGDPSLVRSVVLRRPYGTVMVVPSPLAVMEKVPVLLEVYV